MAEIGFYHLTRQSSERALARLLGRTLASGARALVKLPDGARVDAVDEALWKQTDIAFLPHGTARGGHAALQPVWLTEDDGVAAAPPNDASFLFLVDGAACPVLDRYARVFDLFDGNSDASVAAARLRWKQARGAGGHTLAYWREIDGRWERAQ